MFKMKVLVSRLKFKRLNPPKPAQQFHVAKISCSKFCMFYSNLDRLLTCDLVDLKTAGANSSSSSNCSIALILVRCSSKVKLTFEVVDLDSTPCSFSFSSAAAELNRHFLIKGLFKIVNIFPNKHNSFRWDGAANHKYLLLLQY